MMENRGKRRKKGGRMEGRRKGGIYKKDGEEGVRRSERGKRKKIVREEDTHC